MFKDLCSVGSHTRMFYTATVSDIFRDEKGEKVLLKGIMLDNNKVLDTAVYPKKLFNSILHLRKHDIVGFTATVQQKRKPVVFLSTNKPNYVEYEYILTDLAKITHCNKEVNVPFPAELNDLPIHPKANSVAKKHPFKLVKMTNSCETVYRLYCGDKDIVFPLDYSIEQIREAWTKECKAS